MRSETNLRRPCTHTQQSEKQNTRKLVSSPFLTDEDDDSAVKIKLALSEHWSSDFSEDNTSQPDDHEKQENRAT